MFGKKHKELRDSITLLEKGNERLTTIILEQMAKDHLTML